MSFGIRSNRPARLTLIPHWSWITQGASATADPMQDNELFLTGQTTSVSKVVLVKHNLFALLTFSSCAFLLILP